MNSECYEHYIDSRPNQQGLNGCLQPINLINFWADELKWSHNILFYGSDDELCAERSR